MTDWHDYDRVNAQEQAREDAPATITLSREVVERVVEALLKSALDAHSWMCEPRGKYLFKNCPNRACARDRAALATLREGMEGAG